MSDALGERTPAHAIPSEQRQIRRSDPSVLTLVWLIAGLAGLGAAMAPGRPTGVWLADLVWRVALAAIVSLATSRSRRWPCVWLAGISMAFADGWNLAYAVGAFALAIVGVFSPLRNRVIGAAVGALSVQALLRLPDLGFHGLSAIIVTVAVVPVLWSGYSCAHRSTRQLIRRAGFIGFVVVALAIIGLGVAGAIAYPKLSQAVDDTRTGRQLLEESELSEAALNFDRAAASFDRAHESLGSPWALPARLVPVLAQHSTIVSEASASGEELATSAAIVATTAPYQQLRASAGQVDLVTVAAMQDPVANSVGMLRQVRDRLAHARSPWLSQPLAEQLEIFSDELDDALPEAELASEALAVAPTLLGSGGTRRYLVLFTSPAETRFLGGFSGAYGVLTATDGKVTFDESGSISELNRLGDNQSRTLPDWPGRAEYEQRYRRFFPQTFFQNLTVSPDFPTDALVSRDLYRQVTGQTVDGVLAVDPFALEGFLELTGPVEVEGLENRINAENVVDYLLFDQYIQFAGDNEERRERLGDVADATFDALTSRELPGPSRVGEALGSAIVEKHLLVWMANGEDQSLFSDLGAGGAFKTDTGGDFFSLRTANGSANKIDTYLQRAVDYDTIYNPETGATKSTVTITLTNSSPTLLPDYIIGNSSGAPPGTNVMYLSFYSPLQLTSAKRDGLPLATSSQKELGANAYSMPLQIPPGRPVTLTLELRGQLPPTTHYTLTMLSQPMVNDDEVTVSIHADSDAWNLRSTPPLETTDGVASWKGTLSADKRLGVRFGAEP